ncbi:MAG: Uma2 family endonuclease, partial [Arthrospira platensis PCC 7345]|nr:Uma2 family endonuclease [Arthrospira platensis PCC 7345]
VENRQLRFFSPDGVLVPTPEESATKYQNELITTQNQLEIERQQKDQLAAKLRELGIDPEQL